MRFVPPTYDELGRLRTLPGFVLADGVGELSVWNEDGDMTAVVRRPDGTRGHAYGGPVYDPPEFRNVCQRCDIEGGRELCARRDVCPSKPHGLTEPEMRTATALAVRVGWLP